MNLTINIESIDRTSDIDLRTFKIEDKINDKVNTLYCEIRKYGSLTFSPTIGDEIEVLDGVDRIFSGIILKVEEELEKGNTQRFKTRAVDYTHELDRELVVERYSEKTVNYIIDDILTNYASGFTDTNVACAIEVESIAFDHITVSETFQKLAEATNYSWYVDYDKDIHFFEKNTELSPFGLTDTGGKHIFDSLKLKDDLSQVRNKVEIRGGEIEGDSRTEVLSGNGTRKTFVLGNKFASKPTITVGGGAQTVGIDWLDDEASFDCFWNFNEKYVRFKAGTIPPNVANNISITGIPLIPIIVQVQDDDSIATYGLYEFYRKDTSIKTKEEAKQYALAELEAYCDSVVEGSFNTYESGLRSGQTINIQSTIRGVDEDFLIQSVMLQMLSPTKGFWVVRIATLRTIGIIALLQRLLLSGRLEIKESENEVLYKYYIDERTINITEDISVHTDYEDYKAVGITELIRKDPFVVDWVLAPYYPTSDADKKRPLRLDISSYLY